MGGHGQIPACMVGHHVHLHMVRFPFCCSSEAQRPCRQAKGTSRCVTGCTLLLLAF